MKKIAWAAAALLLSGSASVYAQSSPGAGPDGQMPSSPPSSGMPNDRTHPDTSTPGMPSDQTPASPSSPSMPNDQAPSSDNPGTPSPGSMGNAPGSMGNSPGSMGSSPQTYQSMPSQSAMPPPPAEAMNKDYPLCSRTIQDSCMNPSEAGGHRTAARTHIKRRMTSQ